jgi:hypothetical protein
MEKNNLVYRIMEHDDCDNVVMFLNDCSNDITIDDWKWYVYQNPYGNSRVYLSENKQNELVGIVGYSPTKINVNRVKYSATIGHSLVINTKNRNILTYLDLMQYSLNNESSKGVDFCIGPPNNNSYQVHKRLMSWYDFGHLDLMSIERKNYKNKEHTGKCIELDLFSNEFEILNKKIFSGHQFFFDNDISRMNWRYTQRPSADYMIYGYIENDTICGYMVVKKWENESGYRIGHIMEIQALNAAGILSLINTAYEYTFDCDELDVWCVAGYPYLDIFTKEGFKPKLRRPIAIKPIMQRSWDESTMKFPVNGPASFMFGDVDTY